MELLILSHLQEASEFQNFVSLVEQELPVFFFFRETKKLWFFNELVYTDRNESKYDSIESGVKINGEEEGFWTEWYKNGAKYSEGSYRNGVQEGFWIRWWDNGEKHSEGSYLNGQGDGPWRSWYENGEKESEGSYQNGEREGLWKVWDSNGEKLSEGSYRNGELIE